MNGVMVRICQMVRKSLLCCFILKNAKGETIGEERKNVYLCFLDDLLWFNSLRGISKSVLKVERENKATFDRAMVGDVEERRSGRMRGMVYATGYLYDTKCSQ